jgi:hypothetical protein
LEEAVDSPGWEWRTTEANPFVGIQSESARQGGDLAAGVLSPDGLFNFQDPVASWMETTVEGPRVFQIFVRSNGDPYLSAGIEVDGMEADQWTLEYAWGQPGEWRAFSAAIRPGPHTVRVWGCFGCDEAGALPVDNPTIEIDQATLLPLDPGIGEAMDAPNQHWFAGGQVSVVVGQDAHDGTDAVRSDLAEGISWVETIVEGPATASWWRKGRASIQIDGLAVQDDLEVEWIRDVFFVPSGSKVIRWSDHDQGPGGKRSTLDQFSAIPAPEISLEVALDSVQTLTQGGGGIWKGVTTEAAPDGKDMAWLVVRSEDDATWLETVIEGPASLEYEAVVRGDLSLTVTANEQEIDHASGYIFGEKAHLHRCLLPPGTHRILWEATQGLSQFSGHALLILDQLTITPLQGVSLVEALDDPGLLWTTGGDRPWSGVVSALAFDGEDVVVSPELTAGESSWLETTVTGPGTFSYQCQPRFGALSQRKWELLIDGEVLAWAPDYSRSAINSRFLELGPGEHSVRWVIEGALAGSALVLDRVQWVPAAQPAFAEALDLPPSEIHWQSVGWSALIDGARDGGDALRFGPVGTFTTLTPLTLRVQGPAEISFYAKTGPHCSLRYESNGVPREVVTTDGAWEHIYLQIPPGDREIHLVPGGSTTVPSLENSVWVDELRITPNAISIADVLDPFAPGLEWTTNPANPWTGIDRSGLSDVVAAGRSLTDEVSWLETRVEGPTVIKFLARGQGRDTYPIVPGIRVLVDGNESATVYSTLRQWLVIYLRTGQHTLRFEAAQGVQQRNPEFQQLSVAPMRGEPTIRLVDGHLEVSVPRPAGFLDAQIGMNVSTRLTGLREPLAGRHPYTIFQSREEYLVLRYEVRLFGSPKTLFGAARFDP